MKTNYLMITAIALINITMFALWANMPPPRMVNLPRGSWQAVRLVTDEETGQIVAEKISMQETKKGKQK